MVDDLRPQHEVADLLALLQAARHAREEDAPHVEVVAHRRGLRAFAGERHYGGRGSCSTAGATGAQRMV